MKTRKFSLLGILFTLFIFVLYFNTAFAQDAADVDPEHYKVEFENEQVRVLRITYGPGDKSVMHYHPEGMVVFLTDAKGKFTLPDGKTEELNWKKGDFFWVPAQTHQPENVGDKSFELIQIEMKNMDDD